MLITTCSRRRTLHCFESWSQAVQRDEADGVTLDNRKNGVRRNSTQGWKRSQVMETGVQVWVGYMRNRHPGATARFRGLWWRAYAKGCGRRSSCDFASTERKMPKKPTTAQPAWAPVVALLKKDAPVDEIRKALLAAVPAGLPAAANPNRSGETLLHYAARAHRVDVLRLLVEEFSGNVNAANNHGDSFLPSPLRTLLQSEPAFRFGAAQVFGLTPFHAHAGCLGRQAIHEGIDDLDTTNYLLSAGADQ
ncbi:MAG: hypothetical protein BJ554DRAFT_1868, partial [Olpidium bornovanus]